MPHHEGVLCRGVDGHSVFIDLCDRHIRLHGVGIDHREIVLGLDDGRGLGKGCLHVAPTDMSILTEIGTAASSHIPFKSAQRPGRKFPFMEERRPLGHGLLRIQNGL